MAASLLLHLAVQLSTAASSLLDAAASPTLPVDTAVELVPSAEVWEALPSASASASASAHMQGGVDAAVVFSSASFGGGPLQGLSATQEEVMLLVWPEATLGLLLLAKPMAPREALLLRGLRGRGGCGEADTADAADGAARRGGRGEARASGR